MLSFQSSGSAGSDTQRPKGPAKDKNSKSKPNRSTGRDNRNNKAAGFSKNNVFQKPGAKDFKSRSATPQAVGSGTSSLTLTVTELQNDSIIGQFAFDASSFTKRTRSKRNLPSFLIYPTITLNAGVIEQDPWDKSNQDKMLQMEAQASDPTAIYEDFQKMRDTEREMMEQRGLVDKEGQAKSLENAISFRGSCLDMCPVFERVRRAVENDIRKYERDAQGKVSRQLAVKAFSRPAAGQPPPLPSDVRPPAVLVKTLDYLIDNILDKLPEAQSFLWDRTRSIRQDFTYQNFFGPESIECHEKIVRVHIVTLHVMAKSTMEYSQQQELEQMNKALKTLSEMYMEFRARGAIAPNEAEFRAYYLLSQIRDPELDREIQALPDDIIQDERVQLALNLRNMVQTNVVERGSQDTEGTLNLYKTFFQSFKSGNVPLLMSYLLEIHLNEIRFYALRCLKAGLHPKSKAHTAAYIHDLLAFDSEKELETFCGYYGIEIAILDGVNVVDLQSLSHRSHLIPDKSPLKQPYSSRHDHKVQSLKSLVNIGKSNLGALSVPDDPVPVVEKPHQAPKLEEVEDEEAMRLRLIEEEKERTRLQEVQRQRQEEERKIQLQREEEARIQKEKEEEQKRLQEVKSRMIQKHEARRKKKLELTESIGNSVLQEVMRHTVQTGIHRVLTPLIREKMAAKRRKEAILTSFSAGLYEAFISEIVYKESLEALATEFRERKLKKTLVSKVSTIAHELKKAHDLKKRKREELLEASKSFGIPKVVKRKKAKHEVSSFVHDQTQVIQPTATNSMVRPIDLSAFGFENLLQNLTRSPFEEYEMLVYAEEFDSTTSKFIQRKFGILGDGMTRTLHKGKTTLDIIGTFKIDPHYFEKVNVLVFNCDGIEKIRTQRLLLKELVDGVSLNTSYKFDIVVIYWEFEGIIQFSTSEILQELHIPQHDAIRSVQIVKLDPSLNCQKLEATLNQLGQKVELTARGEYNQKYKKPSKPVFVDEEANNKKRFQIALDSPNISRANVSGIVHPKMKKSLKNLERHIEDSPRAKPIPKLLSTGITGGNGGFAVPQLKGMAQFEKNTTKAKPKIYTESPVSFGDMFKPKKNKLKIDVYSTPRPKSSELLQTPSFASNSSSISNLSNITFANQSISTPIINKPTYAQVASGGISGSSSQLQKDDEEDVPKSILELRKLAASVKEKHGKKQ